MTPATKVSSDTWHRLAHAQILGMRLGEETLTDLLVLEMLHFQKSSALKVTQLTRHDEARCGADLLVWIRRKNGLSSFLAIQAKKLYPNGRYKTLNHLVHTGVHQIDRLDAFARQHHAVPLYLLYNYFKSANPTGYWHCCKPFDIEQLGCTLVPSWKIAHAISHRGQRTFTAVHATAPSRPWRCIFDCDSPENQLTALAVGPSRELFSQVARPDGGREKALVPYLQSLRIDLPDSLIQMTKPLSTAAFDQLRRQINEKSGNAACDVSSSECEPLYPRKLLIVDYAGASDESDTHSDLIEGT